MAEYFEKQQVFVFVFGLDDPIGVSVSAEREKIILLTSAGWLEAGVTA